MNPEFDPLVLAMATLKLVAIAGAIFASAEVLARLGMWWEAWHQGRARRRFLKRMRDSRVVMKRNWGFADGRAIR